MVIDFICRYLSFFPVRYDYNFLMGELSDEVYKQRKVVATSIASPLASLIAKFVTYPIDTIKTKVQADQISMRNISSYKLGRSFDLSMYQIR